MKEALRNGLLMKNGSYEHLLLPRRVPKKSARGSLSVGRKRTSVTGTRKLKRNDSAIFKESSSEQYPSILRYEAIQRLEPNHQSSSEPPSQSAAPGKPTREPRKYVRFDEDSDWVDVYDQDIPDRYQEEQDEIYVTMANYVTMNGDEYILL